MDRAVLALRPRDQHSVVALSAIDGGVVTDIVTMDGGLTRLSAVPRPASIGYFGASEEEWWLNDRSGRVGFVRADGGERLVFDGGMWLFDVVGRDDPVAYMISSTASDAGRSVFMMRSGWASPVELFVLPADSATGIGLREDGGLVVSVMGPYWAPVQFASFTFGSADICPPPSAP